MSDDTILYDSPLSFVQEFLRSEDCLAQSVIPRSEGVYECACSCGNWRTTVSSTEEGLALARRHTGSAQPAVTSDPARPAAGQQSEGRGVG